MTRATSPAWQQAYSRLAPREQRLVALAAAVLVLAALWWLLLAPALHSLRQVADEGPRLAQQLQAMQQLQARAQALKTQPTLAPDDARRALEAAVRQRLGSGASFTTLGDQMTVQIKSVSPQALAEWLVQARVNARATPVQAQLKPVPGSADWQGSVVLRWATP